MRLFMGVCFALSVLAQTSCGPQPKVKQSSEKTTTDGTGYKPTEEEKSQLQVARLYQLAVEHGAIQVSNLSHNSVTLQMMIRVNNRDIAFTLDQRIENNQTQTTNRSDVVWSDPDLGLNIKTYRFVSSETGVENLGLEYKLSRSTNSKPSSHFLRIRLDRLNDRNIVVKQKFEYPSKSELKHWVFN